MSDELHIAPVIIQIAARVHTLTAQLQTVINSIYTEELLTGSDNTHNHLIETSAHLKEALNCLARAHLAEKLAEGRGGKK